MTNTAALHLLSVLLVATLSLATCVATPGCQWAKTADEAVWGTQDKPAEPAPGSAPPIVEIIASVAATLGFGGMAGWLARVKKASNNGISNLGIDIQDKLDAVNARLDTHLADHS
jgi:hypothetical protein